MSQAPPNATLRSLWRFSMSLALLAGCAVLATGCSKSDETGQSAAAPASGARAAAGSVASSIGIDDEDPATSEDPAAPGEKAAGDAPKPEDGAEAVAAAPKTNDEPAPTVDATDTTTPDPDGEDATEAKDPTETGLAEPSEVDDSPPPAGTVGSWAGPLPPLEQWKMAEVPRRPPLGPNMLTRGPTCVGFRDVGTGVVMKSLQTVEHRGQPREEYHILYHRIEPNVTTRVMFRRPRAGAADFWRKRTEKFKMHIGVLRPRSCLAARKFGPTTFGGITENGRVLTAQRDGHLWVAVGDDAPVAVKALEVGETVSEVFFHPNLPFALFVIDRRTQELHERLPLLLPFDKLADYALDVPPPAGSTTAPELAAASPNAGEPDSEAPDDTPAAGAGDPEAGDPEAGDPEAGDPETADPEGTEPETAEAETAEAETAEAETAEPETAEPETAEPDDATEATEPDGDARASESTDSAAADPPNEDATDDAAPGEAAVAPGEDDGTEQAAAEPPVEAPGSDGTDSETAADVSEADTPDTAASDATDAAPANGTSGTPTSPSGVGTADPKPGTRPEATASAPGEAPSPAAPQPADPGTAAAAPDPEVAANPPEQASAVSPDGAVQNPTVQNPGRAPGEFASVSEPTFARGQQGCIAFSGSGASSFVALRSLDKKGRAVLDVLELPAGAGPPALVRRHVLSPNLTARLADVAAVNRVLTLARAEGCTAATQRTDSQWFAASGGQPVLIQAVDGEVTASWAGGRRVALASLDPRSDERVIAVHQHPTRNTVLVLISGAHGTWATAIDLTLP